jgi:hypothetical protein
MRFKCFEKKSADEILFFRHPKAPNPTLDVKRTPSKKPHCLQTLRKYAEVASTVHPDTAPKKMMLTISFLEALIEVSGRLIPLP